LRRSWLRLFWAGIVVAGALVGYLATSGLGQRLLQQEVETQLSRRLGGPVTVAAVELGLEDGLRLELRGLEAFPRATPSEPPALRAHRVLAWIDVLALLIGRLEVSTLIVEGPQLQIERNADGSFVDLPLPPLTPTVGPANESAEDLIRLLEGLDPRASELVANFRAANRIEVRDGSLNWIESRQGIEHAAPEILRLELINGVAERNWLSRSVSLDARAVFLDGRHAPFPIEVGVARQNGTHFDWSLALSKVPLALAKAPLSEVVDLDALSGTFDAKWRLRSGETGGHVLDFEGTIRDATFSWHGSESILENETAQLKAQLEFDAKRLRVTGGRLAGGRLELDFGGVVDRPIEPAARARIESHLVGVRFEDLGTLAHRIGRDSNFGIALSRVTERVESGVVRSVEMAGTARLEQWQDLFAGRSHDLPDGILLGGAFSNTVFGTSDDDRLENLAGEVEWHEDRLTLRNLSGTYQGSPLPRMNAILEGVSQLIRNAERPGPALATPPALPGLVPLAELLKPQDPDALPPVKAIGLAIDELDHPVFRWPLRDLRVLVEPQRGGLQLYVREGTWGDASIQGEVLWFGGSGDPSIEAHLTLGAPSVGGPENEPTLATEAPAATAAPETTEPPLADRPPAIGDRWGKGRFEIDFRPRPKLPFQHATGFFRLEGAQLVGQDVEIELEGRGQFAARARVDLAQKETIGLDLSFALTDGRAEGLNEFLALPKDLVTGDLGATGSLAGRVRPGASFIAELDGRIHIDAKQGRVRTNVPLLLRLAKATEGYNPFANEDQLQYESMTGTLDLDHGRLSANDFELEGPLRVFAKAQIDTNRPHGEIHAVVGIFLFRAPNQILANLPLVRSFLPGSKRGLIGAYFDVEGPLNEPAVDMLEMKTLISAVPDAIKAPFKVLRYLFERPESDS
jgi:uncharacterized protein involved in outer membrane biogenesis